MPDRFLTPEEIRSLTAKMRRPAQIKVLNALHINHKVRPNGSIAIHADHVARAFGSVENSVLRSKKPVSPNWAALT